MIRKMNRSKKFMNGRYGIDDLYYANFYLYITLMLINIFVKSQLINVICFILIIIMLFRFFSKSTTKRKKENEKFLDIKSKILLPINKFKKIHNSDYIYKKCPRCKTTLKLPLPLQIGIKHAKCPKCQKRISMLVLRKQKVEIIKN